MKLYISTPMYGGMCTGQYVTSLIELLKVLGERGHQVMYSKVYNESLITRARNTLVNDFIKSDADGILFIDADHGFNANDVARMIESGEDLIGAVYPMKSINWERVSQAIATGKDNIDLYTGFFSANMIRQETTTVKLSEPLEMDNVATGMMFISRKVFETIAPSCDEYNAVGPNGIVSFDEKVTEYFKTSIDSDGTLLSEDYHLCRVWQQHGGKVYGAPWVGITHFGSYEFKGSFAHSLVLQSEMEQYELKEAEAQPE